MLRSRLAFLRASCLALASLSLVCAPRPSRVPPSPADIAPAGGAEPGPARIVHHVIDARLDPGAAWLDASDLVSFRMAEHGDRDAAIHLILHRDLEIRDVVPSAAGASWQSFPSADARFFAARPDSSDSLFLRRAQEIVLAPPEGGWPDRFEVRFDYGGVVYDSLREPATPYARSFPMSEGLIDTAGAYLAGSTVWVPGGLDDLATFSLTVDLPADWRSMSQGMLRDSTLSGDRRRETWVSPDPMDEIYLVAGRFHVTRETWNGIEMLTYLYHPEPEITAKYLDATRRALDRYSKLIGPYPFGKFALVENFWQTGYGMPSFTLLGDRVIRLPFIVDTSYPHEILHNWWGNSVYVDLRGGNWCEGLTTYGADYLSKEERSASEARDYRRAVLIDYVNYVRERNDFPVEKFAGRSDPVTQNVGYGKGMMIYHMLRRSLGDDVFWAGLRRFYREHRFRPAGWRDLVDALAEESGRDLDGFYAQWIARPGAPGLTLEEPVTASSDGGWRTTGRIRQSASPPFPLRVPVVLRSAGAETIVVIDLDGAAREFRVTTPWRPASLGVDPGFDCFRVVDRREIPTTLSQTLGADSALVVIASSLPAGLADACRAAVKEFAGDGSRVRVVAEDEVTAEELRGRAAWLLGHGALATTLLAEVAPALLGHASVSPEAWTIDGRTFDASGRTLALSVANPADANLSWTFVLTRDAASMPSVGRKLPHYGKYGYLVFEGDRNVAKGTLDPADSPLEARL